MAKMKNAPVYYALAQVRFNQLAAIETYVPAIQESLRKAGYPDFAQIQMAHLMFSGGLPKPNVLTRYQFLNAAKTSGFILDQSWLSFQTSDYATHQPFFDALLEGLQVVHSEATLSYSERVGLRYLDAVCPNDGETPSTYLQSSVLGLSEKLEGLDLVHSVSETRTSKGPFSLVGRAIIQKQDGGGAAFPEDLQPVPLKLLDRFSNIAGTYAILDTDCWTEERHDFDLPYLAETLETLRGNVRRSFDAMITPDALKIWG